MYHKYKDTLFIVRNEKEKQQILILIGWNQQMFIIFTQTKIPFYQYIFAALYLSV